MTGSILIGNRPVGEGKPCYIIAEAGVNHNGDVTLAKQLIKAAAAAGADAVKFQTFVTGSVVTKDAEKADYQKETTGGEESQYDMIRKLELTPGNFRTLHRYAARRHITFLSTPADLSSLEVLVGLDLPAMKVSSGEVTNAPLLKAIGKTGKPVFLSTGMSTLGEIEGAIRFLREGGAGAIILLHCVTSYPAALGEANLLAIRTLRCAFKLPVGYSDHTAGLLAPLAARVLGACVIEKHFTLNHDLPGPDHRASLEPAELADMIRGIRDIEGALGDGIKRPSPQEESIRRVARRSIVACADIPAGVRIKEGMLSLKRPGSGLDPAFLPWIVGAYSRKRIKKDTLISLSDLDFRG